MPMKLPEYALHCIELLEQAGFPTYAVGGCVRDAVLGLQPHDFDLCTAATPEEMQQVFATYRLVLAGLKHGTVGVITEGQVVEITTFRTEGDYTDSRHPGWVRFVRNIEDDLARRDFTVNAMAYSPTRGYADPFGGQKDLAAGVLRAVGEPVNRFTEDALRILRGVRFSVKYGLTPEKATLQAMFSLASTMEHLAKERIFEELCKLLPLINARQCCLFAPVLCQVIPELTPLQGFDQKSPYHIYDIYTHTAVAVENTPPGLALRWAALLHDIGKPACFITDEKGVGHFPGHAQVSVQMAEAVLIRLKAPTALRTQVVQLIERHMTPLTADRKLLRRRLNQYGAEGARLQLLLQKADCIATGTREDDREWAPVEEMLEDLLAEAACLQLKDLAVTGKDLAAIGFLPGKAMGQCLHHLLSQVVDEVLPNEKAALLEEAKKFL